MTSLDHTEVSCLVAFIRKRSPQRPSRKAAYAHMGALIADLAFQRRANYESVVKPKVNELRERLSGQPNTHHLVRWLDQNDQAERLKIYRSPGKWQVVEDVARLFAAEGLDTVEQTQAAFSTSQRREDLRDKLIRIHNVGKKTRDYIDILLGSDHGRAIDSRIRRAFTMAGIKQPKYDDGVALIDATSKALGWTPQEVDSALWAAGNERA